MSQIYVPITSSTPSIPTSFVTNSGTAVPAANVLNVLGATGITTTGSGNTITITSVESGYVGTGTTNGAQIVDILSVPTTTNEAFVCTCQVVGYDSANMLAIGGEIIAVGRNDAGVVTIVSTPETVTLNDAALGPATFTVRNVSPNFVVTVTGVIGHVINWKTSALVTQLP